MSRKKIGAFKIVENMMYSRHHCWIKKEGRHVRIGVDDYLQKLIGKITIIELPFINDILSRLQKFAVMESINKRIDLYSPLSGKIIQVNNKLISNPNLIKQDCYELGWIIVLFPSNFKKESEKLIVGTEAHKWITEELKKRKKYLHHI